MLITRRKRYPDRRYKKREANWSSRFWVTYLEETPTSLKFNRSTAHHAILLEMEVKAAHGASLICVLLFLALMMIDAQHSNPASNCRVWNLKRQIHRSDGCKVEFIVQACKGSCDSIEIPSVRRHCRCCRSAGNLATQNLTFHCASGDVTISAPSVTKCACRRCPWKRSEHNLPTIDYLIHGKNAIFTW